MNAKVLSSISAALVVASFVPPASAEPLGDHPAVVVARTWNNRPIDTNTFIVAPPASTQWVNEAPKSANEPAHAGESPKLHWSAAIGTGYTARTTDPSNVTSVDPNAGATARRDWTATIGTGTAANSRSTESDSNASSSSGPRQAVASAHWTSKIGSGHAADSGKPVAYASVANSR